MISEVPKLFAYARDVDDEPYINLAICAAAAYLVSRDNDLLDLMSDPDFCERFPNLKVIDPVAFLQQMSASSRPEKGENDTGMRQGGD